MNLILLDEQNRNAVYLSHHRPEPLVSLAHKAPVSKCHLQNAKFLVAPVDVETTFTLAATNIHEQHHNAFTIIKNAKLTKIPGSTVRSKA